jgi:hypothetical protein
MVFTPTKCDEVAIVVVEVVEFRRISGVMKEIGRTRRDMQVAVESCPNNMAPKVLGQNKFCVQEGDTICFDVSTMDSLQSGQTVGDSVELSWNSGINGATFTIQNPGARNKQGRFCWIVPAGAKRPMPYTFSVHAMDNNCPRRAEAYKGFSIYVGRCDTVLSTNYLQRNISLFPVPVKAGESLHINLGHGGTFQYTITDLNGKEVMAGYAISGAEIHLPAQLRDGVYVIKTRVGNVLSTSKIMVIE